MIIMSRDPDQAVMEQYLELQWLKFNFEDVPRAF